MKTLHQLLRVRMKTSRFQKLQKIAETETEQSGNYISVSDIVRIAIENWLQTYEAQQRVKSAFEDKRD